MRAASCRGTLRARHTPSQRPSIACAAAGATGTQTQRQTRRTQESVADKLGPSAHRFAARQDVERDDDAVVALHHEKEGGEGLVRCVAQPQLAVVRGKPPVMDNHITRLQSTNRYRSA